MASPKNWSKQQELKVNSKAVKRRGASQLRVWQNTKTDARVVVKKSQSPHAKYFYKLVSPNVDDHLGGADTIDDVERKAVDWMRNHPHAGFYIALRKLSERDGGRQEAMLKREFVGPRGNNDVEMIHDEFKVDQEASLQQNKRMLEREFHLPVKVVDHSN